MDQLTTWGPGLDAELDYRRIKLAADYQRGTPRLVATTARAVRALVARLRDAARSAGATLDVVAARTDADEWATAVSDLRADGRVERRAHEISAALDGLRPADGTTPRAA